MNVLLYQDKCDLLLYYAKELVYNTGADGLPFCIGPMKIDDQCFITSKAFF